MCMPCPATILARCCATVSGCLSISRGFFTQSSWQRTGALAICGSVNLDFRSLWEHYEGGVLFTGGQVVEDIEATILDIQKDSRELHYEEWKRRSLFQKIVEQVLCLLAPLM